jgi:hypothetical protein
MVRRTLPRLAVLVLITFFSVFLAPARGQEESRSGPAHVSRVDGSVAVEHGGQVDRAPLNLPLLPGDRIHTDEGRIEVMLPDGSVLAVDRGTSIEFQGNDLLKLEDGRARLTIAAPMQTPSVRIDSPAGSVRIAEAGEYRVTILHGSGAQGSSQGETQIELAVSRGAADIFTDEGSTRVRPGEVAYASAGLLPSYTYQFNPDTVDDFDRWADGQPDARLGASTQYLPSDMREYSSTFDEYGDWQYEPVYGYVWYPRVAVGWRPYYNGRWNSYPRYGWTWIGSDAFAWPTHHYGRWGMVHNAWFWIPGSNWGAAYVSWAYAPGYVSWCPLGFNNHAVVGIGVGHASAWNAWTVVTASHFGRGYVPGGVVRSSAWAAGTQPAFQVRPMGPTAADVAVPRFVNRGNTIVQSATARAVAPQRDSSPGPAAARMSALRAQSTAIPRTQTGFAAQPVQPVQSTQPRSRDIRSTTPSGSIPVYRGTVPRSGSTPGYRTAPPSTSAAPAITRQAAPLSAPSAPRYAPRYEPRQTIGPARTGPTQPMLMRSVPSGAIPGAIPGGLSPIGPAGGIRPGTQPAAPGAAPAARPAPAGRGGSVAVPRAGGRGGGGKDL